MRVILGFVFCIIAKQVSAGVNIDSLLDVMTRYSLTKDYLEYRVEMKRYDSSRKHLLSTIPMHFKFQRPDYHLIFNNQVEKIYFRQNYYEINHNDSTIIIVKNTPLDSSYMDFDGIIAKLKSYKFVYSIEKEDKNTIKIEMQLPEKVDGFYMSLVIDKKMNRVLQNQLNKVELENGKPKIFFYQADYKDWIKDADRKLDITPIENILKSEEAKRLSKYKDYKIEYR